MYLQKFEVKNKTALVTGAGKGIGKASAIALAEAGADLIILSRTESDLKKVEIDITKLKRKCKFFVCDLFDDNQIINIFSENFLTLNKNDMYYRDFCPFWALTSPCYVIK